MVRRLIANLLSTGRRLVAHFAHSSPACDHHSIFKGRCQVVPRVFAHNLHRSRSAGTSIRGACGGYIDLAVPHFSHAGSREWRIAWQDSHSSNSRVEHDGQV